jgi:hypothetical protein
VDQHRMGQELLPDEALDAMMTREALRPFQPRPGSAGLPPMLEVTTHGWEPRILLFVLQLDDFNDGSARRRHLTELGRRLGEDGVRVIVVRFGSEAWMRHETPEQTAERQAAGKVPDDYPDREERLAVLLSTIDQRARLATAPLYRRASGEVERVGAWRQEAWSRAWWPLLEAFWQGYAQAYLQGRETLQ